MIALEDTITIRIIIAIPKYKLTFLKMGKNIFKLGVIIK